MNSSGKRCLDSMIDFCDTCCDGLQIGECFLFAIGGGGKEGFLFRSSLTSIFLPYTYIKVKGKKGAAHLFFNLFVFLIVMSRLD